MLAAPKFNGRSSAILAREAGRDEAVNLYVDYVNTIYAEGRIGPFARDKLLERLDVPVFNANWHRAHDPDGTSSHQLGGNTTEEILSLYPQWQGYA